MHIDGGQIRGQNGGSVMCMCHFTVMGWVHLVYLERDITANKYKILLTDDFYPTMKHFYAVGSGLFQGDSAPIHGSLNDLMRMTVI